MASPRVNQHITEVEIVYKSDGQQFQSLMETLFNTYVKNSSSEIIDRMKGENSNDERL